jgi:hypothetical protein
MKVGWKAGVFKERRRRKYITFHAECESVKVEEYNCAIGLEIEFEIPCGEAGRPEQFPYTGKFLCKDRLKCDSLRINWT